MCQHSAGLKEMVVGIGNEHRINAVGWQHWIIRFSKPGLNVRQAVLIQCAPKFLKRPLVYVDANDLP
ncbi:hypothetical protein SBA3_690039 [Candidatus Sulfopaludibacter sp. SbA3]|nr:hypothetical protein SBA3_690039 [Candidatus Sulfopaludibacter sp. SbA3]